MPTHVEHGITLKRTDGTKKMTEETVNEEELFVTTIDAEGNITLTPVV